MCWGGHVLTLQAAESLDETTAALEREGAGDQSLIEAVTRWVIEEMIKKFAERVINLPPDT